VQRSFNWQEKIIQDNYYYNDTNGYIGTNELTVRIRKKKNKCYLQVKIPKLNEASLSIKEEREVEVTDIYQKIPSDIIKQVIDNELGEVFQIGKLTTKQKICMIDSCEMALDQKYYLGITDYELELECSGKVPSYIQQHLKEIGIGFDRCAFGKNKRFEIQYNKKK